MVMRKFVCCSLIFSTWIAGFAQKARELNEVVVSARRPAKEIGIQKTDFDSVALKENISLSLADVLAFNSAVYVKNYGRATTSTVAFRGTSASHTQVTWNGMRIGNPMLGMTDFSTIPAYFIDRASLLHGTSSINETGGGLGGLVRLGTNPDMPEGLNIQYVQGIGSFSTFDEFLRVGFSNKKWVTSTRAVLMSSPNDYPYINHDKKENIYDDSHNIVGQYYPKEKNRSGAYRDFQLLQEVYFTPTDRDKIGLNAWYVNSNRQLPMLTTDYGELRKFENRQREQTFRGLLMWDRLRPDWKLSVKGGYIHTWMAYDYKKEVAEDIWSVMTRSRSRINTLFLLGEFDWSPSSKWNFNVALNMHQQLVRCEDSNMIRQEGDKAVVGYDKGRVELTGSATVRWQPLQRMGLAAVVREEMYGDRFSSVIPAFFIDGLLTADGRLTAKASVSSNYRFPSLNDLYFLPGGNPDLKAEHGLSYDTGLAWRFGRPGKFDLYAEATWFDSYIDDWIMWLPTTKGFYTPRNVKTVHAYGVEVKGDLGISPFRGWTLDVSLNYSWTPSINRGEKISDADLSVGKQLPYVPRHSASASGKVSWKGWSMAYKWCFYSRRYTMTSNEQTISGSLPPYFMNNVSLEKNLTFKLVNLQLKLAVNNLFNEDYVTVLSRPMPGINFEFFVGISTKI